MGEPPAPFVRFSRDKRGYESVYLVHVSGRPPRPRVLYWFRTPPGVKLGRTPFDENVRKALEAQYPELRFDWKRITEAQPPPVSEGEVWRERRRAERSAKQARQAAMRERAEVSAVAGPGDLTAGGESQDSSSQGDIDGAGADGEAIDDDLTGEEAADADQGAAEPVPSESGVEPGPVAQGEGEVPPGRRRRRRRRRGRGRHGQAGPPATGGPIAGDSGTVSTQPLSESPQPDPEFRAGLPAPDDEPAS